MGCCLAPFRWIGYLLRRKIVIHIQLVDQSVGKIPDDPDEAVPYLRAQKQDIQRNLEIALAARNARSK